MMDGKKVMKTDAAVHTIGRQEFIDLLAKTYKPVVHASKRGLLRTRYRYLVTWEDVTYFTETSKPFQFTDYVQVINVKKIKI